MNKKSIPFVLLAVTVLPALFATVAFAHTQAAPQYNILLAGSPHLDENYNDPEWRAAHTTIVGDVQTWNDGVNLHITFTTYGGPWMIMESHVAVYISNDVSGISEIPQTGSGNPKIGNFPFKHENLGGITLDEYVIPLSAITGLGETGATAGDRLVIAAQAVVSNGCTCETAWADCGGPSAFFPGGSWAMYFWYLVQ